MYTPLKMKLSDRIRPNSEAAPWVIDEVKRLEAELEVAQVFHRVTVCQRDAAYAELRKHKGTIGAVFDRDVCEQTHARPLPTSEGKGLSS